MEQKVESLFKRERLSRFNPIIWSALIGTLVARTSYFMAWPFLIVFLYRDYGASEIEVGAMLAGSAVVGVIAGLFAGYLSDKLGRKWMIILGALLASIGYTGIGISAELWQFAVFINICGLMRAMIESPTKALIGDNLTDSQDRELALNIRYFLINLGGAIGPLIGITLALSKPQLLFIATGFVYLMFMVWFWVCFIKWPEKSKDASSAELPNFRGTMKVIARDKIFRLLVVANLLMMFIYGQLESSLPQVLIRTDIEYAAKLIAALVIVNTLTIIIFQFPLLKLMERFPLFKRTQIGMLLMTIGLTGFLITPENWVAGWVLSCFVIAIGEVIAFPTLSVQIDKVAPDHLRGSYFGASTVYSLGFALAPLVGGVMLQTWNPNWLWSLCILACVVMIALYTKVENWDSKQNTMKDEVLSEQA